MAESCRKVVYRQQIAVFDLAEEHDKDRLSSEKWHSSYTSPLPRQQENEAALRSHQVTAQKSHKRKAHRYPASYL